MSYDYRSSRWLAVSVTKVESALTVSKEQFSGQILIKAEPQEKFKVSLSCLCALIHSILFYGIFTAFRAFSANREYKQGVIGLLVTNVAVTEGNLLTSCHVTVGGFEVLEINLPAIET